jgi:hypothetical protein
MVAPVCARGYPLLIYPFDFDTLQLWPWFSQRETYSTCNHALVSPPVLRTLIFHLCRNPWLLPHKAFAYRRLLQACRTADFFRRVEAGRIAEMQPPNLGQHAHGHHSVLPAWRPSRQLNMCANFRCKFPAEADQFFARINTASNMKPGRY